MKTSTSPPLLPHRSPSSGSVTSSGGAGGSGNPATFRRSTPSNPYFLEEIKALVGNASLSVKCICLTVICSYLLSYYEPAVWALSVSPGHLLPPSFRFWTLVTHPFLEIHLWEVIVDLITVGLCGKLIEPLWGTKEMLFFFWVVNLSVVCLSVTYYVLLYALTFDPGVLFEVKIHGLSGYIAAVSVTVRQIMPDHVLLRTPLGKITNRNIPLTVLFVSILIWAIGLLEGSYCTMFGSGILSSWIYLRFYQRHSNGTRGDTTDFFTFASFFPNVLQPPISIVSNSIYEFFIKIGVCRKHVKKFTDSSGLPSSIHISIPPHGEKSDAERRKQKALKLLNERLGAGSSSSKSDDKVPLLSAESLHGHEDDELGSLSMHRSLSAGANLVQTAGSSDTSILMT